MKRHNLFFLITFIWTWGLLSIPIIFRLPITNNLALVFYSFAGIAPTTVGIILAYKTENKEYVKDFWKRILNFRLIKLKWYLIIILIIPFTSILAIFINYLFTNSLPHFDTLKTYLNKNIINIFLFIPFTFIFGPIPEEIGWRGYALDHLEKNHNFLSSSLILGFFWSLWHLPMFFISGTYQNELLNESIFLFIDFNIAIFASSVIMDWIYNKNNKSILSGVLVHFCINFFGELFDLPIEIMYTRTFVQVVIAIILLLNYSKKKFI